MPIPISTTPLRISERLPSIGPIKRPIIIPSVDMISVMQPIANAMAMMFTCKNARPAPTTIVSRLVAIAVVTNSQKLWRRSDASFSSLAPRRLSMRMSLPKKISKIKAIQWFHSRTNLLASIPILQPISGVSVLTAPKIRPVRNASENLGLCRVAPLPIDATKVSTDMPKARRIVAVNDNVLTGVSIKHIIIPEKMHVAIV